MDGRYCCLWSPAPQCGPSATSFLPPLAHQNPAPVRFRAIDRASCRAAVGRSGTAASIVLLAPVLKHGTGHGNCLYFALSCHTSAPTWGFKGYWGRADDAAADSCKKAAMPTIALVDDDRNILTSVSIALEAEGYRITTYTDGASALDGFKTAPPDLAILDIKMPRMDGMETLRRLRQKSD